MSVDVQLILLTHNIIKILLSKKSDEMVLESYKIVENGGRGIV